VVVAELDEPRHPLHTGGAAAAPLFAQVAPGQLAHHGIFLRREEVRGARAPSGSAQRMQPQVARSEPQAAEPPAVASAAPAPSPVASKGAAPAVALSAFRDRVLLPDFVGLSKSEVRQVTAKNGLRVKLEGDGIAARQDPPPGSVVVAGSEIVRIQFRPAKPGGAAAIASARGAR
jgi:hypothetical protein